MLRGRQSTYQLERYRLADEVVSNVIVTGAVFIAGVIFFVDLLLYLRLVSLYRNGSVLNYFQHILAVCVCFGNSLVLYEVVAAVEVCKLVAAGSCGACCCVGLVKISAYDLCESVKDFFVLSKCVVNVLRAAACSERDADVCVSLQSSEKILTINAVAPLHIGHRLSSLGGAYITVKYLVSIVFVTGSRVSDGKCVAGSCCCGNAHRGCTRCHAYSHQHRCRSACNSFGFFHNRFLSF